MKITAIVLGPGDEIPVSEALFNLALFNSGSALHLLMLSKAVCNPAVAFVLSTVFAYVLKGTWIGCGLDVDQHQKPEIIFYVENRGDLQIANVNHIYGHAWKFRSAKLLSDIENASSSREHRLIMSPVFYCLI